MKPNEVLFMNSITFECEIITPMLLAGADGKTPELRPPSIKGMMRYWWRAIKAEDDIDKLRKEESEIFGSSDEKIGKSKFSIRVISKNLFSDNFSPVPHSNKTFKFQGYKPGQKFSIMIFGNNDISLYQKILDMTLLLGGLGKRSRRGFGSVHCASWKFPNINVLQKFLLDKLNSIQNDFENINGKIKRKSNPCGKYPFIKEISFGKIIPDYNDLLKKIGQASHNHRDNSLGSGNPRMASPIYVTIVKMNNDFIPVITTLNSVFPPDGYRYNIQKQDNFKGALI